MTRRSTLLGLFAALVLAMPVTAGSGWSWPVDVDEDPELTVEGRPSIALHDGKVHVAVAGTENLRGIRLETIDGSSVTVEQVTTRNDHQPSLAISDAGVFHIAFSRRGGTCSPAPCTRGIYHARSTNGVDWTIERVHRGDHDVHPSLALDPNGRPWIYFRAGRRVFESHRVGGEWSNAFVGFDCCGPDPLAGPEAIVVGGQGGTASGPLGLSPFIRLSVYREGEADGRLILQVITTDTIFTDVITEANDAHDPDITLDDDQDWHAVYRREGDGLWYAHARPNGTIERTKVANADIHQLYGMPTIAPLPGGKVLIVAAAGSSHGLIYRTNASGEWRGGKIPGTYSLGAAIVPTAVTYPTWPVLATTEAGAARVAFLRDGEDWSLWLVKHGPDW